MNSLFYSKTGKQMFLLVSARHVGNSMLVLIRMGKTFLRISRIRNIPLI